ncbi:hypothetical protein [Yoonia sp.]|uniref:hypothetical protein n=1 Tax=Yoonia sp. TaxID=2212373 RepID=UPI0025D31A17|nr:hypothetical protein [Yoonia sp.]
MTITLDGSSLTLSDLDAVARGEALVAVSHDAAVFARVQGLCEAKFRYGGI